LDAIFQDAVFYKKRTACLSNPAAAIKSKLREQMPTAKAGQFAALPYREVPGFMARLRQQQGIAPRCLEFALLTASRTGEVLGARWAEFDLESATWTIPRDRMKADEAHVVYLSQPALDVLAGQRGLDSAIVFPSPMLKGRPLSNMAMLNVLGRMQLRDRTTVHGVCRSSFSTRAYETAAARDYVIEASLAHQEADRVKAAYNRATYDDERRALMASWGSFLVSQCDGANVVPFKAANA
jgi:integrase